MSDKITLEQFEVKFSPIKDEAHKLNKRLGELHNEFIKIANTVEPTDAEEDTFKDKMFDAAGMFIENIDYEYSEVNPGSVDIWQASTC